MRRRGSVLAVVIALAAGCSGTTSPPPAPASAADARGAPAMLQAQVRSAALGLVEAYRATVLGGDALEPLAATPLMRRFAHWLGVTNDAFPGEIVATANVRGLGPAVLVEPEGPVLQVELAASVDVVAQPPDGSDPIEFSVPLDGPVRLVATDPGTWGFVDFSRFGRPVSRAFLPLDLVYERPGVRVTLDAFGTLPNWSYFVRIASTGPEVLSLDARDASLVDAAGEVVAQAVDVSEPLSEIAPGGAIEGAITFEPPEVVRGIALRIDVSGSGGPVPLEIPLRSLLPPSSDAP